MGRMVSGTSRSAFTSEEIKRTSQAVNRPHCRGKKARIMRAFFICIVSLEIS